MPSKNVDEVESEIEEETKEDMEEVGKKKKKELSISPYSSKRANWSSSTR